VANPRHPVKIATLPATDGNMLWGQTFSPGGQVLATGCHGGTEPGARPAIRACSRAGQPPRSRSKAGQHQTPQQADQRSPMSASNPAPGTRRRPVSASLSVICRVRSSRAPTRPINRAAQPSIDCFDGVPNGHSARRLGAGLGAGHSLGAVAKSLLDLRMPVPDFLLPGWAGVRSQGGRRSCGGKIRLRLNSRHGVFLRSLAAADLVTPDLF
jgi:hypothetical protein